MTTQKYNVYAIRFDNGEKRLIAENKTKADAQAIIDMAVIRRGCETEYYREELI